MSEQKTSAPVEGSPEQAPPEQTELGSRERVTPRRLFRIADLGQLWPIVLIVAGVLILVGRNRRN